MLAGVLIHFPDVGHRFHREVEGIERARVRDLLEIVEAAADRLEMSGDLRDPVVPILAIRHVGLLGAPQLGESELESPAKVGEDPLSALLVGERGVRKPDLIPREGQCREC